ncbi:putative uncharacterized domain protein [Janthinobacterium agaricidamnosum NBRC 102515 = DSM 9628]|uniref:Uncharacterized domain protein n=2 Tax=Janthinobacterium agaricidamnosum TaxID=55508 RepID=W0V9C9_9BURK|nr:putative uncharacterized domain protein [Janthinobacterium agaricidamnosum NBRC 102515 = DSM 9628]
MPPELPAPLPFRSQRTFIRQVLAQELGLPARAHAASDAYRAQMNRDGSPSDCVAAGYAWVPGTELNRTLIAID